MVLRDKILTSFGSSLKREKILIFSLFLCHAIAFVFIATRTQSWLLNDSLAYMNLAKNLAVGSFGFETASNFEPQGVRSFGYPVFVLICQLLPGNFDLNVVIVQGILYLTSVFLIWKLTRSIFCKSVSFVFLAVLLFYPFIAYQSCLVLPENICLFLLVAAAFVLDVLLRKNFIYTGFAAVGFLSGLAMYFRPNLFPLPFFLAFIFLLVHKKCRRAVLFLPLAAIPTTLPNVIYNYQTFGKVSPVPIYGGAQTSLWMATWHARVSTDTILKYRRGEITPALAASGMFEQMAEINRKVGVREDLFPIDMISYADNATRARVQEEYGKAAIENIRETPGIYLKSCFINLFRMWVSAHLSHSGISFWARFYLISIGVFVLLCGFGGLILSIKNSVYLSSPFVVFASAAIIFHSVTLCWSHTEARYTIPARLFLVAFAAYGIFGFYEIVRNYFNRKKIKS